MKGAHLRGIITYSEYYIITGITQSLYACMCKYIVNTKYKGHSDNVKTCSVLCTGPQYNFVGHHHLRLVRMEVYNVEPEFCQRDVQNSTVV